MRTYRSRMIALAAAATMWMSGCGDVDDGFTTALPTDDNVSVRVPGSTAENALSAEQPLLGDTSDFYVQTYRTSRFINGHVVGLLRRIRNITSHRPTSRSGTTAVWGPHTPGGLEPLTYRLTVEKIGEHLFSLNLEGRPKQSQAESDYLTLLDGQIQGSGNQDGRGKGNLVLHFDNSSSINPTVQERGEVNIAFDATGSPRTIGVDFVDFQGARHQRRHDATYRYSENADTSGSFLFSVDHNIHRRPELSGEETVALRSRWNANGAGRGDVTVSGVEVAQQLSHHGLSETQVRATECWGEDYKVVFQDTSPAELREEIRPLEGSPAACAVNLAEYPPAI